jgi:predicted nucleic acid-binding protein
MLYLDTSALLKLYVLEEGSDAVQAFIESQEDPLPVWEIQEMELLSALQLKVFWKELTRSEAARQASLFRERKARGLMYMPELSRDAVLERFRKLTEVTPKLGCRTMDILHVACACQLEVNQFLTFDQRQAKLAQHSGLKVAEL